MQDKETESSRAEIQRKLTRMVRFIELEGDEKTQEIYDRTEEEFHIEKGNLIQKARIKINLEYDKKFALLANQSQVAMGAIKATYRAQMLESKRKTLADLHDEIYSRISQDLNCVTRRWTVLQLLIMEALFRLLEVDVVIQCREIDAVIISTHITELEAKYRLHTKMDINLTLDSEYIKYDIIPGIVLIAHDGKLLIKNTLRKRVDQIVECSTPLLSTLFYGTKQFRTTQLHK